MKTVYLDYAAATPMAKSVHLAMEPYFSERFHNPSALYLSGRGVKADLEAARSDVARELGARPAEIVFVAGGTEANNLAIRGIMEKHKGKMLISSVEHESVRAASERYKISEITVDSRGVINLETLRSAIDDETVLLSVIYASNEMGSVQPIAEIGELVAEIRRERKKRGLDSPLFFHTDAAQAANYLGINPSRLGVDLMSLNGGKIYGPKASGVLYVRAGVTLESQILGGGQEFGLRSGTENVPASIGFAEALKQVRAKSKSESARLSVLRDALRDDLEAKIPGIVFHGHKTRRLPNNLSFAIPGFDNETLMMQLDELGYQVATGSACSAQKTEASHVLLSMGVSEAEARSTLRVSLGQATTSEQLTAFAAELTKLTAK